MPSVEGRGTRGCAGLVCAVPSAGERGPVLLWKTRPRYFYPPSLSLHLCLPLKPLPLSGSSSPLGLSRAGNRLFCDPLTCPEINLSEGRRKDSKEAGTHVGLRARGHPLSCQPPG